MHIPGIMKKKALVVVAHPDDETIWMGGTILSNACRWNFTIISLCRKDDGDREPKFRKACRILKAKCFISDLEDDTLDDVPSSQIIDKIKRYAGKHYDYIFTHGENGEYGHKRHIDVNKAVVRMLNEKQLSAKKVFFFSYAKKGNVCCPNDSSDKFIKLNEIYFKEKKRLIQDIYGFEKGGFEDLCCKNTEAFNIRKLR